MPSCKIVFPAATALPRFLSLQIRTTSHQLHLLFKRAAYFKERKMRNPRVFILLFHLLVLFGFGCQEVAAQTSTTGDLIGVVTDPTSAVIPATKVELRDLEHGTSRETKTNDAGGYRFSLLSPGQYEVDVKATGFQAIARTTTVSIGQVT